MIMWWIAGAWIAGVWFGATVMAIAKSSSQESGQPTAVSKPCQHLNWYLHESMILCRSCEQPIPLVRDSGAISWTGTGTGTSTR